MTNVRVTEMKSLWKIFWKCGATVCWSLELSSLMVQPDMRYLSHASICRRRLTILAELVRSKLFWRGIYPTTLAGSSSLVHLKTSSAKLRMTKVMKSKVQQPQHSTLHASCASRGIWHRDAKTLNASSWEILQVLRLSSSIYYHH